MKKLLLYILLFSAMSSYAQFEEHFTDGGFNQNPHWDSLAPLQFRVFNQVLRLAGNSSGGRAGLVTVDTVGLSAEWSIYLRLGFQPSDNDYAQIVLVSNAQDIRNAYNGYYVQIGRNGASDGIDFYRKDGNSDVLLKRMLIGDFQNGANGNLKVVKNNLGKWYFYWKNFDQPNYILADSTQERTYNISSSYFGMVCNYTAATKDSFWFDDVYSIRMPILPEDLTPPTVVNALSVNSKQVDVYFDEAVDAITAQSILNYFLSPANANPVTVTVDANNNRLVHLQFASKLVSNTTYTLITKNIKDSVGNIMTVQNTKQFTTPYFAVLNDVWANELMIKPPSSSSLPNKQYIELKNKTNQTIRLKDWTINGATILDGYLMPNSYIIVCDKADTSAFKLIGNTVGVDSWNALTNDGVILLKSNDNSTIDSLPYLDNYYKDAVKQLGGWSMELNEAGYSGNCRNELFWTASINSNGGTPGVANVLGFPSISVVSIDTLLSLNTIEVRFNNAPMDKVEAEKISNYSIDNGISVVSVSSLDIYSTKVKVTFNRDLDSNTIYHFIIKNINGCTGYNHLTRTSEIALTAIPKPGELILNEVLFNPNDGGVQFVEVYNTTSSKLFKLKDIWLSQADIVSGFDNVILKMDSISGYIFPENYVAFSKNKNTLQAQYANTNSANCVDVNLPTLDTKEDIVVLKGADNTEVDKLHFNENWHFPLLISENKVKGISLERTEFNVSTQNKRNWHSAAADTNATPAYQNTIDSYELLGDVHIIPEVFSPDGDGLDDIASITYSFTEDGSTVNVYLYNADGRLANHLAKDVPIAKEGVFIWNGLDEDGNKKDVGIYFLVFERKTANGKKIIYKKKCVLAAKI
jgi:hypothetical protein